MNSKKELRSLFTKMTYLFGETAFLYDLSYEYDQADGQVTDLFGYTMQCFSDGHYRSISYSNVVRKIFLAAIIQMIKRNMIHIDISDLLDMELEQFDYIRYITGGEKAGAVVEKMFFRLLSEYGYVHEFNSYKSESFMDSVYEIAFSDKMDDMEENTRNAFKDIVDEKDYMIIKDFIYNLPLSACSMVSDDVIPESMEINTIYNSNLTKILKKATACMSDAERKVFDAAYWLNDVIVGDDLSTDGRIDYNNEVLFAYCNWMHQCFSYDGSLYYSYKKDYRDLNLAVFFIIPLIDIMLDDCDL